MEENKQKKCWKKNGQTQTKDKYVWKLTKNNQIKKAETNRKLSKTMGTY